MRIRHKVNHGWTPDRTDREWAARVEREATAVTEATERAYEKARQRLERAEQRLARLSSGDSADSRRIATAEAVVERRRQELLVVHRLMTGSPASAQHRGPRSFRGIARGEAL